MKENVSKENNKILTKEIQNEKVLTIILKCPLCKTNNPQILNIKKDISKNQIVITFICKCINKPKEISLSDFYKISISNLEKENNRKCYKHLEKEGIEYCEKCKKILCEICKDYHKDFIEGHKTVSINLLNINNCNIHLGKKLNLFCENCELNICSECQNNKHKDHNVICLNDYWKKINDKLTFNCVEELKEKLETEKKNFESIINNSIEKINYLVNKFEKLRTFILDFYQTTIENNKLFSEIIISSFKEFFDKKENSDFSIINNCKQLTPINLIYNEELNELEKIFKGFSNFFNILTNYESSIVKRNLVKVIENKNSPIKNNLKENNDSNNNTVENNSTQSFSIKKEIEINDQTNNGFLNKKTKLDNSISDNNIVKKKSKYIFKIPLNDEAKKINEYYTNNSSNQLLNKNKFEKMKKESPNDNVFSNGKSGKNISTKNEENEINNWTNILNINENVSNEDDPNFFNNIFYKNNTISNLDNSFQYLNYSILNSDIGITENYLNIEKS